MSDTPTYDQKPSKPLMSDPTGALSGRPAATYEQLSALCAQMAAALEDNARLASLLRSDLMGRVDASKLAALESISNGSMSAITAYSTLSPDPRWQRVPEKPSADVVQAAIDTFGVQPGYAAMERAIKAAFSCARGENGK